MDGPHQGQTLATAGSPLSAATGACVFVHGRGATAQGILGMRSEFTVSDIAFLAPQAANNTWYPNAFTAPVEMNEPGRSSGLEAIDTVIDEITANDIPRKRVLVLGFSQGACLASEYVARNPTRYGGLAVLSGGLIGERVSPDEYPGSLERTPVFLGCSDADPHIPRQRVEQSAMIFEHLDADVTKRLYQGMGHGINRDELEFVSEMIDSLAST
ncbi:alpha/beta hydrolase [Halocatena halophila]|uniref:alpha/beta hydrolase n=1 Tax=Halocatena halophila TaxID=2814576 RepID=UPI002ED247AD